ncbi:hypothetical protein C8R43DRAFT_1140577 [Mycena crocata]|nr:hypothetical protein C8R43DRAFT_1140577 [Mycena crocata]
MAWRNGVHLWRLHEYSYSYSSGSLPTPSSTPSEVPTSTPAVVPASSPVTEAPRPHNAEAFKFDPHRRTCPMPYFPDEGVDKDTHSGKSNCKFYVVGPGQKWGCFTNSKTASEMVVGWSNFRNQAWNTYAEALKDWKFVCAMHHGPVCADTRPTVTMQTRIQLTPAAAARFRGQFWAVKGINELFETRAGAFAAADAHDLEDIHIIRSNDVAKLEAFTMA